MAEHPVSMQQVINREYIGPAKTGDNIDAQRAANYNFDPISQQWQRATSAAALIQAPFDYVGFSNADANGNYQTVAFKSGGSSGTTVGTLAITYDGSSQITSITRT